ncbi:MAG: serine/threonine protein kinase [Candidatus Bathyarchaeia archaeon]
MNRLIPLKEPLAEALRPLLCYPRWDEAEFLSRLKELESLNVEAIELSGPTKIFNFQVLGKGCDSIVAASILKGGDRCALKIRRLDASRVDTSHEAEMLEKANAVGIGPKLRGYTRNFITMELIEGKPLPQWIKDLRGRGSSRRLKLVVVEALKQCRLLDSIGLDHGELSRAPKHVIIDHIDQPRIIDFESASVVRRRSNVTALAQYLLVSSSLSREICKRLRIVSRDEVIDALRRYKNEPSDGNFEELLATIELV